MKGRSREEEEEGIAPRVLADAVAHAHLRSRSIRKKLMMVLMVIVVLMMIVVMVMVVVEMMIVVVVIVVMMIVVMVSKETPILKFLPRFVHHIISVGFLNPSVWRAW